MKGPPGFRLARLTAALLCAGCARDLRRAAPPDPEPATAVPSLAELPVEQLRAVLKGYPGDWRPQTPEARGLPAPAPRKPVPPGARVVELPSPSGLTLGTMPLADAVARRRSRRDYTADPLSLDELSFLLWCTQGVSSVVTNEAGAAACSYRTVPSGGARHPFETYLLVSRVTGLAPGLYRFLPMEHRLLVLREDAGLPGRIRRACYGQAFTGNAAVVFAWTAIPDRTEWRYGCIAHRMIAIEAGHVCQNLYLACESIGAGCCAVLGYDQASFDALLGADGRDEFTIYLAPVGKIGKD